MITRPTSRARRLQVPAVLALTGALVTGCAADTPTTTAQTAAGTPSATPPGGASASAATAPTADTSPGAVAAPAPTATGTLDGPASPAPSGVLKAAVVKEIRAADQGTFDRVVIEFQGTFGAWRAGYVPKVTEDGSGDPVSLQGDRFVQVSVQNATFDNAVQVGDGVPHAAYTGPHRLSPMLGNVLEIADAGDFEAVLSLGIGLRTQAGLRAYRLEGPSRLVIDIAH